MQRSIEELINRYPALEKIKAPLEQALLGLYESSKSGGTIFTCGTGGSAFDSEQVASQLLTGTDPKGSLPESVKANFKEQIPGELQSFCTNLQYSIAAISLGTNISSNSDGMNPDFHFAQQLLGLGKKGDILLTISTSDNSENILNALKLAKSIGIKSICLMGSNSGNLANWGDILLNVPATNSLETRELHRPVCNTLCTSLGDILNSDQGPNLQKSSGSASRKRRDLFKPKLLVLDFDGVLTNNKVFVVDDGSELVRCDRSDGLGLSRLKNSDIEIFILSTEVNSVVKARAKKLGIDVHHGCSNKKEYLEEKCLADGIDPSSVIYMGNDLNDLEVMEFVGFSCAPRDAYKPVLDISDLVLSKNGGEGAVRELCDLIFELS